MHKFGNGHVVAQRRSAAIYQRLGEQEAIKEMNKQADFASLEVT